MIMAPRLRNFALVAHITTSVGWLGAVVAYLALAIAALISQDAQTVRAAPPAMESIGWFALVPLSLASILTGLVQSLGTTWGLFRHYWVLAKLLLTLVATIVLLLHMPAVSFLSTATDDVLIAGFWGEIVHATGGLFVLLAVTALSVYKPRGLTPYGWRMQQGERGKVSG